MAGINQAAKAVDVPANAPRADKMIAQSPDTLHRARAYPVAEFSAAKSRKSIAGRPMDMKNAERHALGSLRGVVNVLVYSYDARPPARMHAAHATTKAARLPPAPKMDPQASMPGIAIALTI